jgi:hypothetical protein
VRVVASFDRLAIEDRFAIEDKGCSTTQLRRAKVRLPKRLVFAAANQCPPERSVKVASLKGRIVKVGSIKSGNTNLTAD